MNKILFVISILME